MALFIPPLQQESTKLVSSDIEAKDDAKGTDEVSYLLEPLEGGQHRQYVIRKCTWEDLPELPVFAAYFKPVNI